MDASRNVRLSSEEYLKFVFQQPTAGECLLAIAMNGEMKQEVRQMAAVVTKMVSTSIPFSEISKSIMMCDNCVVAKQLTSGVGKDAISDVFQSILLFSQSVDLNNEFITNRVVSSLSILTVDDSICQKLPFITDIALTDFISKLLGLSYNIKDLPNLVVQLTLLREGNTSVVVPWLRLLCVSRKELYVIAISEMIVKNEKLQQHCESLLGELFVPESSSSLQPAFVLLSCLKNIGKDFSNESIQRLLQSYVITACFPTTNDIKSVRDHPTEYVRHQSKTVRSLASNIIYNLLKSRGSSAVDVVDVILKLIPLEAITRSDCKIVCQVLAVFTPIIRAVGADKLGDKKEPFFEAVLSVIGSRSETLSSSEFFTNAVIDCVLLIAAYTNQVPVDNHLQLLTSLIRLLDSSSQFGCEEALMHAVCAAIDKLGQCYATHQRQHQQQQQQLPFISDSLRLLVKTLKYEEERCCESIAKFCKRFANKCDLETLSSAVTQILTYLTSTDFSKTHPASVYYLFDSIVSLAMQLHKHPITQPNYITIFNNIIKRNAMCEGYVFLVVSGFIWSGMNCFEGLQELIKSAVLSEDNSRFELFEALASVDASCSSDVIQVLLKALPAVSQGSNNRTLIETIMRTHSFISPRYDSGQYLQQTTYVISNLAYPRLLTEVVCRGMAVFGLSVFENPHVWECFKTKLSMRMSHGKRVTAYPVGILRVLCDGLVCGWEVFQSQSEILSMLKLISISLEHEEDSSYSSDEDSCEDEEETHQVTLSGVSGLQSDPPPVLFRTCNSYITSVKSSPSVWIRLQSSIQQAVQSRSAEFLPVLRVLGIS